MKSKFLSIIAIYIFYGSIGMPLKANPSPSPNVTNVNKSSYYEDDFFNFESPRIDSHITISDPYEKINRKIYALYVFGYENTLTYIVPIYRARGPYLGSRLYSFKINLIEGRNFINHALQLRINAATESAFRFLINSTVGILGLFDVMESLGMPSKPNDFGATMYFYRVPAGPYMVILGPLSLRDTVGLLAGFGFSVASMNITIAVKNLNSINKLSYINKIKTSGSVITFMDAVLVYDSFEFSLKQTLDEYTFLKNSVLFIREERLKIISSYD